MLGPVNRFTSGLFGIGKKAISNFRSFGYRKATYNIPYNINDDHFNSRLLDTEKLSALKRAIKPNNEVVVLSSGALIKRKGMDTVIEAFKAVGSPHAKLLILGEGPDRGRLESLKNGDPRIVFSGFLEKEDVPYYFLSADIFILASHYDGWGLVINEAVMADLAIISSLNVGASVDKLTHNESALLYEPLDTDGFTAGLELLISSKSERERLVENASHLKKELSSAFNAKKVYDICCPH